MDVLQAQGHVNEDAAMMGLAIIFVFVIYLLVSAIVVWVTVIWARRHGRNTRRWGWGAVLAMYLLLFWDLIPTVLLHKYRCSTEAGFWVYKTPEQWAKENPGVLETLVVNKGVPDTRVGDMDNYTDTYFLNQRINWVVKKSGPHLVNLWRHEQEVVDHGKKEVLARYVDYSSGYGNWLEGGTRHGWQGAKFWLQNDHCEGGDLNASKLRSFKNSLRGSE